MTVASARPDLLFSCAHRLARLADDVGRAAREEPVSAAVIQAASVATMLTSLAFAVREIGDAFAAADRGASVARTPDARLVHALVERAPGLATGVIAATEHHESARRLGRRLRRASPVEVLRRLALLGNPANLDGETAAGLLEGLGAAGIAGIVRRSAAAADRMEIDSDDHLSLVRRLAGLLATAASGPLDLRLIDRLGAFRDGRLALRAMARRVHGLPTDAVVRLASATLLGSDELDDAWADPRWRTESRAARGRVASVAVLRMLVADPAAARAFELLRPDGPSPTLTAARASATEAGLDASTVLIRRLVLGRDPIDRTVAELTVAAGEIDSRHEVPAAFSRMLATLLARHPAVIDALAGSRENGPPFYEALSRDRHALHRTVVLLSRRRRRLLSHELRRQPPGGGTRPQLSEVCGRTMVPLFDLRAGADAAGRYDRTEVEVAIRAAELLAVAGVAIATPAKATKAAKQADRIADVAVRRLVHVDDDREVEVERRMQEWTPSVVANLMQQDPAWSRLLTSPPPPVHAAAGDLAIWLVAQPEAVRAVIAPLRSTYDVLEATSGQG